MLALAAAFAMLLLLFQGLSAPEEAIAQSSNKKKKSDVESLVASGDSVKGKSGGGSVGEGNAASGPAAMPKTGSVVEEPIMLGLVLLLDGALAFLITSRRNPQAHTAT